MQKPETVRSACALLCCAAVFFGGPAPAVAQHDDHGSAADTVPAVEAAAVPLYGGLGPLERPVTTASPEAQAYFDQALRLTYGFGHGEGIRSFREAQRHDPDCAACHWGEAWALGPHINGRMGNDAAREAHAAIRKAADRAAHASPVERALIEALAVRYAEDPEAAERAVLDSAYARAMDDVAARFPNDLEVLTLAAEAHMVLRPWSYWTDDGDPEPGVERALELLERALGIDVSHPGACHLYIHLVEASPAPARAEPCAELLPDGIPGVSHIPHMPAHVFMRTGRYGDAVRGNQRAWIADQRARFDGAPGVYPTHNLHMLLFAASFDGQSSVAIGAARDLTRLSAGTAFYVPLMLVRFGRWEEALELAVPEASSFVVGMHHFARGMARLRTGDETRARVELTTVDALRAEAGEEARFRGHLQHDLLGMARGVLAGEIHAAAEEWEEAVGALEEAVALEDGLAYDEPEPWPVPVRQHLGAVLLEAGRPADAERVYREALDNHPANGWSLHGLAAALRAQGKDAEATEAEAAFEEAWARADVWITGSRF